MGVGEFLVQSIGEAFDGKLRSVVKRLSRHRHQAEHAGGVDDVAGVGLEQVGQEGLAAVHHAPEVDVHEPVHVGVVEPAHLARHRHAGVVEHQVHGPVLRHHVGCKL